MERGSRATSRCLDQYHSSAPTFLTRARDAAPAARSHFMAARDKRNMRLGRLRHPPREFSGPNPMFDLISTSVGRSARPGIARALSAASRFPKSGGSFTDAAADLTSNAMRHRPRQRHSWTLRHQHTPQPPSTTSPKGLLLQRRHPPLPPTHPTHSLAPSLQCAKVWHAVKKKK